MSLPTAFALPTFMHRSERGQGGVSAARGGPAQTSPVQLACLVAVVLLNIASPASAVTPLADKPLSASSQVPGNLALALSVEYPTAVSVAHTDRNYAAAKTFLGYFDTEKCYVYRHVDKETLTAKSHFYPAAQASARTCTGPSDHMWSGNFLNWATMQTIDPFRWALTGGYRVVDTPRDTILEKGWGSAQGSSANFPTRVVTSAEEIAGATPFKGSGAWNSEVWGQGIHMLVTQADGVTTGGGMLATYFNNLDFSGAPVLTRSEVPNFDWGSSTPGPGSPGSGVTVPFSARWVSSQVAAPGVYSFRITSDDGVRLWVNGTQLTNDSTSWVTRPATTDAELTVTLQDGDPLNVRLDYFNIIGPGIIKLEWKPPGGTWSVFKPGTHLALPIRVKVCDPDALSTAGDSIEKNCVAYANGRYKPEGLMQQYSKKIRYSVFGYLNDSNIRRDGGVLRAQQKFVGPTYPVPGLPDAISPFSEWNPTTGVYFDNPDGVYKALPDTQADVDAADISNSGALNYLNKFGSVTKGTYKTYDPVSELYYAALRYYKNLGNVPDWTDPKAASKAVRTAWADNFPVITEWQDPVQYQCQRNYILGIGDVNTHADRNVPGGTPTASEPSTPAALATDSFNAATATDRVGVMQGMGSSLSTQYSQCCTNASALIAGLAYLANTKDIRPDDSRTTAGKQTVQTYWLDVLERQVYRKDNLFYLAAKYGGFKVPKDFDPDNHTAPLPEALWHTPGATATDNLVGSGATEQLRPNNYFTGGRPDQMVAGLTKAFEDIARSSAVVSANATPLPQLASGGGNISYASSWDRSDANWSGELTASELSFEGESRIPVLATRWQFSKVLAAQLADSGWDTRRVAITWNTDKKLGVPLRTDQLASGQVLALATPYAAGDSAGDYLNYLRGDRRLEGKGYRSRQTLLGDIVGSKPRVVGPPSLALSNSSNLGYSEFKAKWAQRPTVVYVGANDGFLHAVRGKLKDEGAGQELFAYAPGAAFEGPTGRPATNGLAALGNPAYEHRHYVNATPSVFDIDMAKTGGKSGSTPEWRSVLIGGLGKGGKAYYAIDVTDPDGMVGGADAAAKEFNAAGKVLWEFSDSRLGYSYGEPQVVKTRQHGWVVILPSGYNNSDGKGYLFVLNPRTGVLIQAIPTNVGSPATDAGLATLNTFVLDRTDGTADAAYAGDLLGNVWRFDLTPTQGPYPDAVGLAILKDASGAVQPVTSRPLIEIHPRSKRRYVLIGTGRLLATADIGNNQNQSYYALIDGNTARFNRAADLPNGVQFPIERDELVENTNPVIGVAVDPTKKMGWVLDLGAGWRVVSNSTTFYGTVSFAPTFPSGDECSAQGASRVYSLDFENASSELLSGTTSVPFVSVYLADNVTPTVVTDMQYFSTSGSRDLIIAGGGEGEGLKKLDLKPVKTPPPRRLNWRELPVPN